MIYSSKWSWKEEKHCSSVKTAKDILIRELDGGGYKTEKTGNVCNLLLTMSQRSQPVTTATSYF